MKNRATLALLGIVCIASSASIMATDSPPGAPASLAIALRLAPGSGLSYHQAWESMTTWSGGYETGAAIAGYDIGFLLTA